MIMDRLDQAEVDLSRCKAWSHVLTMRIADLEASRKASELAIAEIIQESRENQAQRTRDRASSKHGESRF